MVTPTKATKTMGSDIHGWAEERVGGKWQKKDVKVFGYRTYPSFYLLAGIRNYFSAPFPEPISRPKGFPEDSPVCGEDLNDDSFEGHSASYLTLEEILQYPYWDKVFTERGDTQSLRNLCASLWGDIKSLEQTRCHPEDIRIVFWFDS